MKAEGASSEPPAPRPSEQTEHPSAVAPEFRWQALFQRTGDALFVLNRQRRFLFVNRAWERTTGISAAEARGLVCPRRSPAPQDPPDVVVRCLCCPPAEVLKGQSGRARRLAPGTTQQPEYWDLEFWPLHDGGGLLCVLGRVTRSGQNDSSRAAPLPDKLIALRTATLERYGLERLTSTLPAMQRIVEQVRLAAASEAPVLLIGEAGSGKRWLAHAIHYQSAHREGPFLCLDCTRLPAPVLSRILFATEQVGSTGTIFLRDVPALAKDVQTRLLDWVVEPGTAVRPRLLAGACSDPAAESKAGKLLEPLRFALSTIVISVPPLRDRPADLSRLVEDLLERANSGSQSGVTGLTAAAWDLLRAYSWPGNLAELYAVLRSACYQTPGEQIDVQHLPAALRLAVRLDETPAADPEKPVPLDQLLEQTERRLIVQALRKARGNRSRAAELLAIWRPRLLRRMEALGITEW
jgi:transcriptional regulator with PAS, ATPase and Fis domain